MQMSKILLSAMAIILMAGSIPAFASVPAFAPITATLSWIPSIIPTGATTTATIGIIMDADCPTGETYSGTLTVVEPDGISTGTVAVGATTCGVLLTEIYPTDFTGLADTLTTGVYNATWSGTTSATTGGVHPTFKLTDHFVVIPPNTTNAPEFSAPTMLVAAIGLALMVGLKHRIKHTYK